MSTERVSLPADPDDALDSIRAASTETPVLVFKQSPICPISRHAEEELEAFLALHPSEQRLLVAHVDVIADRALARGLTAALGIQHESPQALLFAGGELVWHGSHGALTRERFEREVGAAR